MGQWDLKGYTAGSILIQIDDVEVCQWEMKGSCVCGGGGDEKRVRDIKAEALLRWA